MKKFKRTAFPFTLTFLYIVFFLSSYLLETKPALIIWFLFAGIVAGAGLSRYIRHIKNGFLPGWKSLEFLLPLLLFIEGLIQFFGKPLFHLMYIPFIVIISGNFPLKIVISCILTILLLGMPAVWWSRGYFTEEGGSYLSILVTGIISYLIFYKKIKLSQKAIKDLEKLKSSALSLESSTETSLFNEDRFSHLVKSILDTESELKEMLNLTRKIMNTDSSSLFMLEGDKLVLKASTEDTYSKSEYHGEGYLLSVIKWNVLQKHLNHYLRQAGHSALL